jgi:hypothetical protein
MSSWFSAAKVVKKQQSTKFFASKKMERHRRWNKTAK